MPTHLNRGFDLMNRVMEPAAAESVTFIRDGSAIEDVAATLSNQQIEQVTDGGATLVGRQFTWRLKRGDLVHSGVSLTPQRGDQIVWIHDGTTYEFLVMPEVGLPASNANDQRTDWLPASVKLMSVG